MAKYLIVTIFSDASHCITVMPKHSDDESDTSEAQRQYANVVRYADKLDHKLREVQLWRNDQMLSRTSYLSQHNPSEE